MMLEPKLYLDQNLQGSNNRKRKAHNLLGNCEVLTIFKGRRDFTSAEGISDGELHSSKTFISPL